MLQVRNNERIDKWMSESIIWHLLPPLNPSHLNCTLLITNAAILLTESTVTSQVLSAPLPPIHDTFLPNPGLDPLYLPSHLPELTCPPSHPSSWCIPASCPPFGSLHTHSSVALCGQVRPPFFLGSRAIPLPTCWTPSPGDLLRHGRTNLNPSQLRTSQVLPVFHPMPSH